MENVRKRFNVPYALVKEFLENEQFYAEFSSVLQHTNESKTNQTKWIRVLGWFIKVIKDINNGYDQNLLLLIT
ncbi:MAG: hypothetical protein LBV22_03000 [Mycoplasmataceae bacterium]|nr:hypothetical protein [Mycoplasmataceae bacterium]